MRLQLRYMLVMIQHIITKGTGIHGGGIVLITTILIMHQDLQENQFIVMIRHLRNLRHISRLSHTEMIEVVIKYDANKEVYVIYEPTTDSMMASTNLTEALVMLNQFLLDTGMSQVDILQCPDISYHIDSQTMKSIIEGNLQLIKRLRQAPSGFMISNQRFGQSPTASNLKVKQQAAQQQTGDNKKKSGRRKSSGFAGATGFKGSFKKFGGNKF